MKFKLRQERHHRHMSLLAELMIWWWWALLQICRAYGAWFGLMALGKELKTAQAPMKTL